jgi:hypothetical protein
MASGNFGSGMIQMAGWESTIDQFIDGSSGIIPGGIQLV